jgi:hypothetical protein
LLEQLASSGEPFNSVHSLITKTVTEDTGDQPDERDGGEGTGLKCPLWEGHPRVQLSGNSPNLVFGSFYGGLIT